MTGLLVAGTAILLLGTATYSFFGIEWTSDTTFWVFGLLLCLFVGPAQSCSRSLLSRVIPPGREAEVFGLYATTGRAASFLAPLAFSTAVVVSGSQHWGIVGLMVVLGLGLALLLPLPVGARTPRGGQPAPR